MTERRRSALRIEVAHALPDRQRIVALAVPAGTTALEALQQSGLLDEFPAIDPARCTLGVFGRPVAHDYRVRAGDRVEIYRPLRMDPREARRRLAERGLTMGSSPGASPDDRREPD